MGYVTTKQSEELGKELNDIIASLGYEIVIKPEDDEKTDENEEEEDE